MSEHTLRKQSSCEGKAYLFGVENNPESYIMDHNIVYYGQSVTTVRPVIIRKEFDIITRTVQSTKILARSQQEMLIICGF